MTCLRKWSSPHPGARHQRGMSLILGIFFMVLAVSSLTLVVDTARLFVEKRKLQRVADLAALETAMRGGLCGSGLLADALTLAQTSATRNGYTGNLATAPNQVELGYLTTTAGVRSFTSSLTQREVVHVRVTRSVPSSLLAGGLFGNQVLLMADATARRTPLATISVGTGTLSVDSTQSPILNGLLGGLLGTSVNLTALQYDGIAKANVSLLAVLNQAGLLNGQVNIGSVNDLLNTQLTAAQVINATLNVLTSQGVAGASVMKTQLISIPTLTLKLGDILSIDPTGVIDETAQLNVRINALDFIMATAQVVNKNSAVAVNLGIPGLTNVQLTVVDPLVTVVGPPGMNLQGNWRTEAKQAQVKLSLDVAPLVLGLLGTSPISLSVNTAAGKAHLTSMNCRTATDTRTDVTVGADTNAAVIKLGSQSNTANPTDFSIANVNVLGLLGVTVKGQLQLTVNLGNSSAVSWTFPVANEATDLPARKTLGGGADMTSVLQSQLALTGLQTCVTLLGLPVCTPRTGSDGTSIINTILTLLVTPLDSVVLTPVVNTVLPLLGVRLGSVDVTLKDIDVGSAELVL